MESYIYWKQDNLKRLHRCFLLEADYDEKIRWAEEAVSSGETGDVLMACYKLLPRTEDLTNLGNNVRQINDLFFRLRICDDLPLELSEARKIAKSYNGSPQEASVNAYIAQRIREGKAFLQTLTENSELKKPEFFKHYLDTLTSHLKYCDIPTQIGRKKIPSEFSSVEMEEIHRRAMEQLPENFCYAFGQLLFYLHRKLRITYKEVIRQYAEEQTE